MSAPTIKTFTGRSEKEVIDNVRQALGRDAIILRARRVRQGGLWGLVGRTVIEMEACNAEIFSRSRRLARRLQEIPPSPAAAAAPPAGSLLLKEIQSLKNLVADVASRVGGDVPDLSPEIQEAYRELVENEVARDIACALVKALNERLPREHLNDPARVREHLLRILAERLPTAGPIRAGAVDPSPGGRGGARRIAFVGPTGVGKTTTVAKLAAQMRLKDGVSVGLITIDTYRLAAVEQIRSYAQILNVPLRVADSPAELARAAQALAGLDAVLIDTTGRSQQDALHISELKTFLDAVGPDEVHLVMSLASNARSMGRVVESFLPLGVTQVVLTKLDEVDAFGLILNVMARVERKLSYVTFGQGVPDDIEPGHPERLARLILRREPLPGMRGGLSRGTA